MQAGTRWLATRCETAPSLQFQRQERLQDVVFDALRLPHEAEGGCKIKFADPFQYFLAVHRVDIAFARPQFGYAQHFVGAGLRIILVYPCQQAAGPATAGEAGKDHAQIRMIGQTDVHDDVFGLMERQRLGEHCMVYAEAWYSGYFILASRAQPGQQRFGRFCVILVR